LEINCTTNPDDALDMPSDLDGDNICDLLDDDADGDGWSNDLEIRLSSRQLITPQLIQSDLDGDGICNYLDEDIDGDKLPNNWEYERNFDPLDPEDVMICHGMIRILFTKL
jgi:hypothetical protein